MQAFNRWLPFAMALTISAAMVFGVAQYLLRQSANDPQIQLAEDWANQISVGTEPTKLSLGAFIDPVHSLATFGIVYDQQGNIANASVAAPTSMRQPDGVFETVNRVANKQARYTWQPSNGARFAAVIQRVTFENSTYYVLAGRNLREVEKRQSQALAITVAVWAVGLVAVFAAQHMHVAHRMYNQAIERVKAK